jgi:MFS family permease
MNTRRPSPGLSNATDDGLTDTNLTVAGTSLSRFNWRLAIALLLGGILWIAPYVGSIGVLMPALVAQIAPDDKVAIVTVLGIAGAALSLVSNVVFGALSDITRTRVGARVPWIVGGALVSAAAMFLFSTATTVPMLILWWCVYMTALNAIIAPMVAEIADRVPEKYRGTVSSVYGVGMLVGATSASIVAAGFVSAPTEGLVVFAVCTILSAVAFVAIAPRTSNVDAERRHLRLGDVLRSFRPPMRGARDFYLALFGKFFLVAGTYAVSNYQLYILTDYIGLPEGETAGIIALNGAITLVTGLVFGFAAGPISDRFGRRKPFVVFSALLVAVGLVFPLVAPAAWAMVVYALFAGIGGGVFNSVDQALNVDVLPDKASAAKDLGILNIANSGGQILGPVIMSLLVAASGGYQAGFLAAVVLLVLAAVLIVPIRSVR